MVDPEELQWQVTVLSTSVKTQFSPPSPNTLTTQYLVRHTSRTPCVCVCECIPAFSNSVHISPTRRLFAHRKIFTMYSDLKLSIVHFTYNRDTNTTSLPTCWTSIWFTEVLLHVSAANCRHHQGAAYSLVLYLDGRNTECSTIVHEAYRISPPPNPP